VARASIYLGQRNAGFVLYVRVGSGLFIIFFSKRFSAIFSRNIKNIGEYRS